jgi:hypothetical protein
MVDEKGVENLITALEDGRDRISHISIEDVNGYAIVKLAAAMQQPLPTLKRLCLRPYEDQWVMVPDLPETFLGGSAPDLEYFELSGIPFPTFPGFILSSPHIRYLHISKIQEIAPNTMAACLAALPNIEYLYISFRSGRPQVTPPLTRIVLPALTTLAFSGVCEYFEDFVAQIDTPLLNKLDVSFIMHDVRLYMNLMDLVLEIPQFRHFIGRAERLKPLGQAVVEFDDRAIWISDSDGHGFPFRFRFQIRGDRPEWQLYMPSMVQIFRQQLPFLSHIKQLIVITQRRPSNLGWMNEDGSSLLLALFHLFITLQRLYLSEELVAPVAAALQQLTEGRTMEVLPALHSLFLEGLEPPGPVPEGIKLFVAARQLSDHPVAAQSWNRS